MKERSIIESASIGDLQQIQSLLELVELPVQGVDVHIEHFFVVRTNTERSPVHSIIGSIGLEVYGVNAVLRSLAVHPIHQGRGIGNELLSKITRYAREKGVEKLYLLTTTADHYFESHGFEVTSRNLVPQSILDSLEFKSICPSTATCLSKSI